MNRVILPSVKIPVGDRNADSDEVEVADFTCPHCAAPIRMRASDLSEYTDNWDPDNLKNWTLNFACDCGFGVLFCECRPLSDHPRIPHNPADWEALIDRMNQMGTRNLM